MNDEKVITVELNEEEVTIGISNNDDQLIHTVFSALSDYATRGFPLKIKRISSDTRSDTARIKTVLISHPGDMEEWINETGTIISAFHRERRS
jgi:hypothetical protein